MSFPEFRLICGRLSSIHEANDETDAITAAFAALERIGFGDVLLSLYDPRTQKIRVEKVSGPSWNDIPEVTEQNLSDNSILSSVLTSNKSRYVVNPAQIPSLCKQLREASGTTGQYLLPVRLNDEMIGTLQINLSEEGRTIEKDEELILQMISTQLAVSISRLRGLKRSTELIEQIMTSSRFIVAETLSGLAIHSLHHKLALIQSNLNRELERKDVRENRFLTGLLGDWRNSFVTIEKDLNEALMYLRRVRDKTAEVTDLHGELLYSRDLWRHLFQASRVLVDLKLEAANYLSRIRAHAFHEIVSVLFVNSVQAHAKQINLRTHNKKNFSAFPGGHIQAAFCLDVSDDGEGLTTDHSEEIFEPTYSARQNKLGVGLGLFIARRLAREAGGDLAVVGLGTGKRGVTFRLVLPYV